MHDAGNDGLIGPIVALVVADPVAFVTTTWTFVLTLTSSSGACRLICVGLTYHNDANSFYSDTYSGSATNECFTVKPVKPTDLF